MVKFMILFQSAAATPAFEDHYNTFLAQVEGMPGITRRQVIHVLGTPRGEAPVKRILEVYFDDMPHMQAALRSSEGQAAGNMLNLFPAGSVDLYFAEVFEEAGARTEGA